MKKGEYKLEARAYTFKFASMFCRASKRTGECHKFDRDGVNVLLFLQNVPSGRSVQKCSLVNDRDSCGKVAHEYRVPLS